MGTPSTGPCTSQNAFRLAGVGLNTHTSDRVDTVATARSPSLASSPLPITASFLGRPSSACSKASAAVEAVRRLVMRRPSTTPDHVGGVAVEDADVVADPLADPVELLVADDPDLTQDAGQHPHPGVAVADLHPSGHGLGAS